MANKQNSIRNKMPVMSIFIFCMIWIVFNAKLIQMRVEKHKISIN